MAKKKYNNRWEHGINLGGISYMYLSLLNDGRIKILLGQRGNATFRRVYNVDTDAVKKLYEALEKLYSGTPAPTQALQQPPAQQNAPVKLPTVAATLADVKAKVLAKEPQATKAYEKWTDKDDKMLRNMHGLGSTVDQMAIALHRGEGAITSRLKKLGLS